MQTAPYTKVESVNLGEESVMNAPAVARYWRQITSGINSITSTLDQRITDVQTVLTRSNLYLTDFTDGNLINDNFYKQVFTIFTFTLNYSFNIY